MQSIIQSLLFPPKSFAGEDDIVKISDYKNRTILAHLSLTKNFFDAAAVLLFLLLLGDSRADENLPYKCSSLSSQRCCSRAKASPKSCVFVFGDCCDVLVVCLLLAASETNTTIIGC